MSNIGYNQLVTVSRIIKELLEGKSRNIRYHHLWLKTYCPYTFYSPREGQVYPENREYLPLGIFPYNPIFTKKELDLYHQFQSIPEDLIDIKSCPKHLTATNSDEVISYYLYHDGNSPWYSRKCLITYYDALCKLLKQ